MDSVEACSEAAGAPRPISPALLLLAAAIAYASLWPQVPGDIDHYLVPWLDHILAKGPVGAFATPFSNYTPPYLYLLALVSPLAAVIPKVSLIKALSVAGTLWLGFAVQRLARSSDPEARGDAWVCVALLPSVAVNAARWGQCDAIWSAACVMAVASAVRDRQLSMLAWFGVAIAFKAQGLFLAPFILLRLVQERTPLRLWLVPGLVYALAMLPAALAGWPAWDLATVYLRQAEWNPAFITTAPNPWSLAQLLAAQAAPGWFWIGDVAAAAATVCYVAVYRSRGFDRHDMIALALLGSCLMPFFLPKMHERFFFLSEVLAFVLAFIEQDRRSLLILLLVESAWLLAVAGAIFQAPLAGAAGALAMGGAMVLLAERLRLRSEAAEQQPQAAAYA